MNKIKFTLFSIVLMLLSCSNIQHESHFSRTPAEDNDSCQDLATNLFLKDNYKKDLNQVLIDKNLLKFSNKFVTVHHPKMDWINKARIALNRSIKNWNNHQYPAFYIFNDEQVILEAKKYFKNMTTNPLYVDSTNFNIVSGWINNYKNYQKDINNLLDERISIQYNLKILKKFKQTEDIQDIKIIISRDGKLEEEILTLRKNDKDLNTLIAKLKGEIKALDGTIFKNGKIKDRIIRQAVLNDILTITQREFEYGLKNTSNPSNKLELELKKMNALLAKTELSPTTYGIYRVTNQVFIREILSATKIEWAYKKFVKIPLVKFKEIVNAFMKKKKNQTEKEKIGIFKRVYAKITALTPKQIAIGSGTVITAGVGLERYFSFTDDPEVIEQVKVEETNTHEANEEVSQDEKDHQEQLKRTQNEDTKRTNDYSEVIEIKLDELLN